METNFQTSFIPKKPMVSQERAPIRPSVSIFMVIGSFVFIISLVLAGLTFVGKSLLLRSQEKAKIDLNENVKRFNAPLIEDLKKANAKIDLAKQLLNNHIAVSEVFNVISMLTTEGVYFNSFEFTAPDGASQDKAFKIKMRGVANNFNSVAWQSDVFGSSQKYGTNKVIKNPVLSNLSVDAKNNVLFDFSADIIQSDISYEKVLTSLLQSEGLIPEN